MSLCPTELPFLSAELPLGQGILGVLGIFETVNSPKSYSKALGEKDFGSRAKFLKILFFFFRNFTYPKSSRSSFCPFLPQNVIIQLPGVVLFGLSD
jgi:hypothetical protein